MRGSRRCYNAEDSVLKYLVCSEKTKMARMKFMNTKINNLIIEETLQAIEALQRSR